MPQRPETVARDWLKTLGTLVAGNLTRPEAELRLTAYGPLLAREFPVEAFTQDTLSRVARDLPSAFFPSYSELCRSLSKVWREMRPLPQLPAPPPEPAREPPTDAEIAAVADTVQQLRAQLAADAVARSIQAGETAPSPPPAPRSLTLSDEVLAASYEQIGTPIALFRAQILRKNLQKTSPKIAEKNASDAPFSPPDG